MGQDKRDKDEFSQTVEMAIAQFPTNRLCKRIDDGSINISHYHAILTTIFHQTYSSPYTFARAAVNCPWRYEIAKEYLLRHAEEERTHWRWILDDLTSTDYSGRSPREGLPNLSCQAYIGLNYFVAEHMPVSRLAIAAVLEGIGARHGTIYPGRLIKSLGLDRDQASFFLSHAETDQTHAAEIKDIISQCDLGSKEWEWMNYSARTAGQFYRGMYDHEAFS
jgi:hypothetical protein